MTERRRPSLDATPVDPIVRALSSRIARLEARVDEQGDSLARLWTLFERRAGSIAPAPAPTPQRGLEPRVGASEAARLIGCDVRTVRRLIASGRLRGSSLPLAGARRRWMAEKADVERLRGAVGGSPAAPAASATGIASKRRTSDARMKP